MTFLWLGMLAGLASSPHCLGMCGPFPLHLSASSGRRAPVLRHLLFLAGKTSSYAFLGALAGFLGQVIFETRAGASWQNAFSFSAGGVMLAAGVAMLGFPPRAKPPAFADRLWLALQPIYQALFRAPGNVGALLLGVGTGFLPCPATFALCAAAAAGHSVSRGLALLAGLGLGTAPVLLAVGLSGGFIGARFRRLGLRGVGIVVALVGATMLLRPTGLLCRLLPGKALAASAYSMVDASRRSEAAARPERNRGGRR